MLKNEKTIYILHNGNGRPYFEAVELFAKSNNYNIIYRETNFLKSFIKMLIGRKCVTCNPKTIILNFYFMLSVLFIKNKTIIYGTAPYDFRFLYYSMLKNKNNFIYHTSHHKWGEDKSSVFLYAFLTPLFKYFWKLVLNSKNIKIVAVTKESKKTLKKNFQLYSKVYQIYHSIDLEKFKIKSKKINQKLKVLFVGRLVYEKGLDILAEVIKSTNNKFDFTIVGDGNYKDKISYIFKEKNVNYLGWINNKDELAAIFKEHDILLNPSIRYKDWEELFGIVNIEAMASGLIVIASDHIGPKEIIQNNQNGFLVEEKKPELIIDLLEQIFNKCNEKELISHQAYQNAIKYDIINISKQWKNIINE